MILERITGKKILAFPKSYLPSCGLEISDSDAD